MQKSRQTTTVYGHCVASDNIDSGVLFHLLLLLLSHSGLCIQASATPPPPCCFPFLVPDRSFHGASGPTINNAARRWSNLSLFFTSVLAFLSCAFHHSLPLGLVPVRTPTRPNVATVNQWLLSRCGQMSVWPDDQLQTRKQAE